MILHGFRPLAMRMSKDCGPTAMMQALRHRGIGVSYEEVLRVWRFREGADRTDTPGHHLLALRRLGVPVSMRRGLGPRRIERALLRGSPVVLLVPTGLFRWHWVVACGIEDGGPVVSPGDGGTVSLRWPGLFGASGERPVCRALRIDGLGYCVGHPLPFETDISLERDLVRLAGVAEGALAPVEPVARCVLSLPRPAGRHRLSCRGT